MASQGLANRLATASQLRRYQARSALPRDLHEAVFVAAQCLTQAAGLLLRLPQSTTAQANVVLARYWLTEPLMKEEFSDASAASLYLVAKMGSFPRSPRQLSVVYDYLLSPGSVFLASSQDDGPLAPSAGHEDGAEEAVYRPQSEADYAAFCTRLLALELDILTSLSFNSRVVLPHPLAVTYLQALDFLSQPKEVFSLRVMRHLNTALLSPQLLYLTHQPHALATAAIYSAAREVGAKMPACPWWEVFDVDREELGFLVVSMTSLDGWFRKRKEDLWPVLGGGMPTREAVRAEMRKRGLPPASTADEDEDEK